MGTPRPVCSGDLAEIRQSTATVFWSAIHDPNLQDEVFAPESPNDDPPRHR
jgi:hypothetical protein